MTPCHACCISLILPRFSLVIVLALNFFIKIVVLMSRSILYFSHFINVATTPNQILSSLFHYLSECTSQ
uniref:Uncharacterized protein n=1 Tax=Arundo donax TaxID=35708 RepID=A0A0A9DGX5_ARUDO